MTSLTTDDHILMSWKLYILVAVRPLEGLTIEHKNSPQQCSGFPSPAPLILHTAM